MEKIIIFGAGDRLGWLMEVNRLKDYDIVAIVDSDVTKQNEFYYGHIIKKPEDIHKLDYDRIIISSEKCFDEIKEMLVEELKVSPMLISHIKMKKYDFELIIQRVLRMENELEMVRQCILDLHTPISIGGGCKEAA